ncbi:MAG TPA: acyl-CoA dehydrogenase family protein [Azospirillaceae bacterium]|nr:acyl-CoA dehydrogenase family protein [Azospirillaceae bacterium]
MISLVKEQTVAKDWRAEAEALSARFKVRAASHDAEGSFVRANFEDLREAGLTVAAAPAEFGGGDLDVPAMGGLLTILGRGCGSTALAFSMHTHQVAVPAWRWRRDKAPVEGLLRRIVGERLFLLSSGGSDWLAGSARAERVEGGYRVTGRKAFVSGAPIGDLLMTMAVLDDPATGPQVLHLPVSMKAEGVRVLDTWNTLGMRGTGSHDVELDGVFVPDAAIGARRTPGEWHPLMHTISLVAFPLIYSAYLGVAEGMRDTALDLAARRRDPARQAPPAGEMDTHLLGARLAVRHMLELAGTASPGAATTNALFQARTLAAREMLAVADRALELAGGAGFYREGGLERMFRDIQGVRYHPLTDKVQADYAGHLALGLDASRVG